MRLLAILALLGGTALAQVGLGGQAGLNAYPVNAPVISAVTESPDSTTVVLAWTTNIASDSRGKCSTEVAADSGIAVVGTSHQIVVAGLVPSTAYTCTVQSGSTTAIVAATTTAVPTSTPVTSVTFNIGSLTDYNTTSPPCLMHGDTYYCAESSDGVDYCTTDDTSTGWSSACNVSSNTMIMKFTSESPFVGASVNALSTYGPQGTNTQNLYSPKQEGMFGMSGNLYTFLTRQNEQGGSNLTQFYGNILESQDHGATWNNYLAQTTYTTTGTDNIPPTATIFTITTPTNFATCSFVLHGADDGTNGYLVAANRINNANAFVYEMCAGTGTSGSSWNNDDKAYLLRCPRAYFLTGGYQNPNNWQAYVSGDGTLDANWTSNLANAGVILTNTGKLSLPSSQYFPALNRYLTAFFYYPSGAGTSSNCTMLVYESEYPWGPFTLVGTQNNTPSGYYNLIFFQRSALAATFASTSVTYFTTGDFHSGATGYHMFIGTMNISH